MKFFYALPFTVVMSVTGCGSQDIEAPKSKPEANKSNETTTKDTHPEYKSPLPDDAPVYKVATTGTQPPFTFKNKYGTLQGIDIDIMRLVGEEQGFKVEFHAEPWVNVFPNIVDGKRDIAISGISYNNERADKYLLSKPYLFVPSAIMYTDENLNINSLKDLKGLRYAGMTDSKQLNDVINNVDDVTIVETDSMFDAYQQMRKGNVDAIAEDIHWLQYTAESFHETKMNIVAYETKDDASAQQVMMFKKDNVKLASLVNEGIDKLVAKGKIKEIEDKWVKE